VFLLAVYFKAEQSFIKNRSVINVLSMNDIRDVGIYLLIGFIVVFHPETVSVMVKVHFPNI